MADIAWPPSIAPTTQAFFIEANTQFLQSPLSRASQVLARPGARWVCRMEFSNRGATIAPRIDALLYDIEGAAFEVTLFDFRRPYPRGAAATNSTATDFTDGYEFTDGTAFIGYASDPVLASAAAKNDETVYTSGWETSTAVLLTGDYVGIAGRLHMVLSDVTSDGSGLATLRLRPRLRADVGAGERVTFVRPLCRMRLTDNAVENRTQAGPLSSYSLSFVEALP